MEKIILYRKEGSKISIYMDMYFNEEGQLIFDGQDIGSGVEEQWGDSDYEYTYTIEPEEVKKLYAILGVPDSDKHSLLQEIKKRFAGNRAYSKFGKFMDDNNINYSSFTWT